MGYNHVFANTWLIGAQTEVSRNLVKTRMVGSSTNNQSSTTSSTNFANPFFLPLQPNVSSQSSQNFSFNGTAESQLSNDWTISVLARLGVLATQDWLLYGLVGWSASGFELDGRSFTLNGFTYGAGVERDFGWFRAFVQFKGINYNSKDFPTSFNNPSSNTNNSPGFQSVSTTSSNTSALQRVSVDDNYFVTVGVTVPLSSFFR
jgi:opacity protein-like surface antigen